MNSALQFDFTINKANNTVNVKREFAAPVEKLWDAWTKSELLDQWWAPKPWHAETKSMDFSVGGYWLYAMIGPDGTKQYCKVTYNSIDQHKSYVAKDAFTDESGVEQPTFPGSLWTNNFAGKGDGTLVDITIQYETLKDLEQVMSMGFKEGFTMGLGNLDELLAL